MDSYYSNEISFLLASLTVYRGLLKRPAGSRMAALLAAHADGGAACYTAAGELAAYLAEAGLHDSIYNAVIEEIKTDNNAFTRTAAAGKPCGKTLSELVRRDLSILYRCAGACLAILTEYGVTAAGSEPAHAPFDRDWEECMEALSAFHQKNGVGEFTKYSGFLWCGQSMYPVRTPDPIRLTALKEYAVQRSRAIDNTLAFISGAPANNILFYGDRGTGKSSTVKALLNEYAPRGLRMVEMPKDELRTLPRLTEQLALLPMKFIIFIDDLSFSGNENDFAALKAVLEGGLAARPKNVLIYATSNRRHLLRENFSNRDGDELHHADTVQESVSLSDRFGICLTFLMPDKQRFLNIVAQLANDEGIGMETDKLLAAAEQWATERGARSPRFARQFIDHIRHQD